jgi:hypothetical protein
VVRNKRRYMAAMYKDHFHTNAYKRLTTEEASTMNQETRSLIIKTMHPGCGASKDTMTYHHRSLKKPKRDNQGYGLPKLHKDPIVDRHIISRVNMITEGISKIADHYMKQIVHHTPTNLRDSQALIDNIKDLGPLPPNTKLFTVDAKAMYTNIQPDVCIHVIQKWMEAYANTVPKNVPQKLLIKLLDIIMRRNVFNFNDTSWLQEIGTSIGTPCACSYTTMSYALHEVQHIIAAFTYFLMILKRFIDDMFSIWISGEGEEWKKIKHALEGFGKLKWMCSDLSNTVVFLDLTLTIASDSHVKTKTYIKPKNLHLYIPATSAHPTGCFKGTVYGNVQRYWNQNSHIKDYQILIQAFAKHLEARGHNIENITHTLLEVATHTDEINQKNNKNKRKSLTTDTQNLFIHWEYHPHDIVQKMIRQIYEETLKGTRALMQ